VLQRFLVIVKVTDRIATHHASLCVNRAAAVEQGLDQTGLTGTGVTDHGDVANVVDCVIGHCDSYLRAKWMQSSFLFDFLNLTAWTYVCA
jgi:hypothetical protein